MKIVMRFPKAGSSEDKNNILCFEYESCEKFLEEFKKLLKPAVQLYKRADKEFDNWKAKVPKRKQNQDDEAYYKSKRIWETKNPKPADPIIYFYFKNIYFMIADFYNYFYDNPKIIMPEVYELNQWFEVNKIEI